MLFAASGQRSLHLAGEIADAALVGSGTHPSSVADAVAAIRAGESAVRREPGSVDIWFVARVSVAGTRDEGYESVKVVLSVAANHALRADLKAERVPAEWVDAARNYCENYSYEHHGLMGPANANVELFERLGMRDFIMERYGVVGDGAQVAGSLSTLENLGVSGVMVPAVGEGADELIRRLGEEVLPLLGTGTDSSRLGAGSTLRPNKP